MDYVWDILATGPTAADAISSKKLDAALKDHARAIKQLLSTHRQVIAANLGEILLKLEPAENSIAFLAFLQVSVDPRHPPAGIERVALLDDTLRFLLNFDPHQVRYVGLSFRKLLETIATGQVFSPLVSIEALATAMLRLDPSGSMFTSTHLLLVKFAYEFSCIEPALKVLDRDITFYPEMAGQKDAKVLCDASVAPASYISVDTGLTDPVKSTSVLEYNLLSGLCYMTRKDWPKAHRALERVITHPSRDKGVSKIMDDAYKRWVLVGLLKDGKEPILPHYTTLWAKNTYNTLGLPYKSVASLFSTANAAQLNGEVEGNRITWEEDNTTALITEVVAAYQKWQIINLRDIYKEISISQLRHITLSAETGEVLTNDDEVTKLVREMIESNLLRGELLQGNNGNDFYLKFHDESEYMTEADFARDIAQRHQNILSLGQQFKAANDRLSGSKEYVRHAVREQKRAEKDGNDPLPAFESQVEDEDLMTGVQAHG
ncbi:hypothetical protein EDB81DRAFT_470078 [Dactylonectria macrodidyma]|uniref:COP9 signalosome complex subunit 3 N-terminal helical repeats domain-containing protein n=1 Tax=Dactylonectria macrodidyma TaxID=307937 RepID=A0A9P9EZ61_9HYPO|nr:hypothetical protein EDB81DRAFT_470078 [Dactylonectria macrodidyma]